MSIGNLLVVAVGWGGKLGGDGHTNSSQWPPAIGGKVGIKDAFGGEPRWRKRRIASWQRRPLNGLVAIYGSR